MGRRRTTELKAALTAAEALSGEVRELRSEVDDLRLENDLLAHSVLIDSHTGLANPTAFELAGSHHQTAKDVYVELEALVSDNAKAGSNRLVWPH